MTGIVLIGPTCPVEREDSPCPDRPVEATLRIVVSASGTVVATVRSGPDGRFRATLAPGTYVIDPVDPAPGRPPSGSDVEFTVEPHRFAEITVSFDSAIR